MKTKKLSALTVKRLNAICDLITKYPYQFDMDHWFIQAPHIKERCGTAGCLAGWALTLKNGPSAQPLKAAKQFLPEFGKEGKGHYNTNIIGGWSYGPAAKIREAAREFLGITTDQANRLFQKANWPETFLCDLDDALPGPEYAEATVNRVKHFIETNGTDGDIAADMRYT